MHHPSRGEGAAPTIRRSAAAGGFRYGPRLRNGFTEKYSTRATMAR